MKKSELRQLIKECLAQIEQPKSRKILVKQNSYNDFLMSNGADIRNALQKLRKIYKQYNNIPFENGVGDQIDDRLKVYDKNVPDQIDR